MPYNDLSAPPPVDAVETRAVLKAAIAANTALAQLDQAAMSMPNPAVLINTIVLLEAQASSEIENIVTTSDELFRHMDGDEAVSDPATRETLRYSTALRAGFEAVLERGLTVATAEHVCITIKGRDMPVRALPGTRIANPNTGEIIYSPPEGRDVLRTKLAEWEQFIHADDGMETLVRLAAAHFQFEAIHPFNYGNGRTGRILNILMLVESGVLRLPVLYLTRYIIQTKADDYRLLLDVTSEGAWEAWILYILKGIEHTSRATIGKFDDIRFLPGDFALRARSASKRWRRRDAGASLRAALLSHRHRHPAMWRVSSHRHPLARRTR